MIHIDFKITTLPKVPMKPERYRLIVDIEGELTISKKNKIIFSHGDILLVEFARSVRRWLEFNDKNITEDFVYNSMDFEEEPVIAFRLQEIGDLLIESSLLEVPGHILFEPEDLIRALKYFLRKLYDALICTGINLKNYDTFTVN